MILVVVAHPDDESLMMGGKIATLARTERVVVVSLADGVGSRFRWYQLMGWMDAAAWRAEQFRTACLALGAEGYMLRVFPDQRADRVSQLSINRAVERLLSRFCPYCVYTHWTGDLNLDHRRVAEAVIVASRPEKARYVRSVYAMQPELPELSLAPWKPTKKLTLDDSALRQKRAACVAYVTELRSVIRQSLSVKPVEEFMEIR